jgi:hypothetical protein
MLPRSAQDDKVCFSALALGTTRLSKLKALQPREVIYEFPLASILAPD